jgi:hypothetical protein
LGMSDGDDVRPVFEQAMTAAGEPVRLLLPPRSAESGRRRVFR